MVWCVLFNHQEKDFKEMNKLFSILDQPIIKDWIFYLWLVSLIAIIPTITSSGLAGLIDLLLAAAFQTVFFMFVPAKIRKSLRGRKSSTNN